MMHIAQCPHHRCDGPLDEAISVPALAEPPMIVQLLNFLRRRPGLRTNTSADGILTRLADKLELMSLSSLCIKPFVAYYIVQSVIPKSFLWSPIVVGTKLV